jgi:hypothetical protein
MDPPFIGKRHGRCAAQRWKKHTCRHKVAKPTPLALAWRIACPKLRVFGLTLRADATIISVAYLNVSL